MDQLIFEQFPPIPPSTRKQLKKAITMKYDYQYDDSAEHIPASIRNRVPSELKKNDKLDLFEGEEGYLYEISPKGLWGMAIFVIQSQIVHTVVPMNFVIIGLDFLPSSEKIQMSNVGQKMSHTIELAAPPNNALDSFIHGLWSKMRAEPEKLEELGISQARYEMLFNDKNFQNNIEKIKQGFLPQARAILERGNATLSDVLELRPVSETWPERCAAIYVRLYTKGSDPPSNADIGVYIGQSRNIQLRNSQHETATRSLKPTESKMHYSRARQSLPENRHMLPLCIWDNISDEVLTMAEQTLILAFRSYHISCVVLASDPDQAKFNLSVNQAMYLRSIARQVAQAVQWSLPLGFGCNINSPLFNYFLSRQISCVRMDKRGRPYTVYRSLVRFQTTLINRHQHLLTYYTDGKINNVLLRILPEATSMGLPKNPMGYLVFEVMDDGQPHEKPWVGVPSVGPFENFGRASALGIRFEWLNDNRWLSIGVYRLCLLTRQSNKVAEGATVESFLGVWRTAMHLIQALEGIIYTNAENGFYRHVDFGAIKVLELKVDHMNQKFDWMPRPTKEQAAPKKADWQYNFTAMVQQFTSPFTLIGPLKEISLKTDAYRLEYTSGLRPYPRCDFCTLTRSASPNHCEQVLGPYGSVCKHCALFNRPCTWTIAGKLFELWGEDPPFLADDARYSKYPTGPYRYLTFYHTEDFEVREVSAPFHKLGLFMGGKPLQEEIGIELEE